MITNKWVFFALAVVGFFVGCALAYAVSTGTIGVYAALPDEMLPDLVKNLNLTSVDLQKEAAKAGK